MALAGTMAILIATGLSARAPYSSAAPPRPSAPKLNAQLESTSLAASQAGEIGLLLSFERPSKGFSYRLDRKQGSRWKSVSKSERQGRFAGLHRLKLKQLFAGRALRAGTYRLRLLPREKGARIVTRWFRIFRGHPISGAVSISLGGYFSCAIFSGRNIECWGDNGNGELGNGGAPGKMSPVAVSGIASAISVSSGFRHACAVLDGGVASCWGNNGVAELGDGTRVNRSTPVTVFGLSGVAQLDTGVAHTCAVISDGTVFCWGDNEVGQLGIGTLNRTPPYGMATPTPVPGIAGARAVSGGYLHTCALVGTGSIQCWGYNRDGELGTGSITPRRPWAEPSPLVVVGIDNAVAISSGNFHTCALFSDGRISCWGAIVGSNFDTLFTSATPVPVEGITNATSISSGGGHSCALLSTGRVKCWGANPWGELGSGNVRDSMIPITVAGVNGAVAIGSGLTHSCAVVKHGTIKCWGSNGEGQLGRGTLGSSYRPISVVLRPENAN